jgi:hypothetical protein
MTASRRPLRRVTALSACVLMSSAAVASTAVAGSTPVYTHKDSGTTVHLGRGTIFKVKLKTCTDCGDAWHWRHRPNRHIVKQLSKRVVSHVQPPAVGGMATTIYRFKVVGTGTTTMRLVETNPSGKRISRFRLTEAAPALPFS